MIIVRTNANLNTLKAKSLELKKKTVNYLSSELLKKCDVYIPFDTGMMRDSGISHSVPEQGKLIWKTPYVKKQWLYGKSKGMRGRQWALRAWADYKNLILEHAEKIANGE